jgi:GntR family transcriptional regulator, transcriptional repressor for pyruvate dehydrogenase complex
MSSTIRIPRASNIVVDALRDWILSERLPDGYKLPNETEMMEMYGLGRTTVREAVRLLESDGLVEVRRGPSGGTFVRHIDIREVSEALTLLFSFRETRLKEFVEFRRVVEPEIAALAAVNATDEQRDEILKVGEEHLTGENDSSVELHELLAAACGNGVLGLLMESMSVPFSRHFRPERITEQSVTSTEAAHAKIAKLVAAGDAAGARRSMARHMDAYAVFVSESGLSEEPIVPRRIGRT